MATPTAQTITITPSTTTYPIGAVVQIATLFATDGVAVDPAVVKFSYKPVALGTATTLVYGTDAALVKDSTGNYHVNLDTTAYGGVWNWRFFSTGTSQSSIESKFYVIPNAAVTTTVTPAALPLAAIVQTLNAVRFADQFTGTDAGVKIRAAVADLPAGGGTVDARGIVGAAAAAATLVLDTKVRLLFDNISLTFATTPGISITAAGAGSEILGNNGTSLITTATSSNVVVAATLTSNVRVSGINFVGGGSSDPVIPSVALDLDRSSYCEVTGCTFSGFNYNIRMIDNTITSTNPTGNNIHHNTFLNAYGDSNGGYGVLHVRGLSNSINNNIFSPGPFGRHAIYISAGSRSTIVDGNLIRYSRLPGIAMNSGTSLPGDLILGINVTNNIIYGPGSFASFAHGIVGTGGMQQFIISNNQVHDSGDIGILLTAANGSTLIKDGIVCDNLIVGPVGTGIILYDCFHVRLGGNVIINANNSNGAGTGTDGIRIDINNAVSTTDNLICNNIAYGTFTRYGLFLNTAATSNFVTGNDFRGCVTGGILDSGSSINWKMSNTTGLAGGEIFDGPLRFVVGNGAGFIIDNAGQQYTELDFAHGGTLRGYVYWDETNSKMAISGPLVLPTVIIGGTTYTLSVVAGVVHAT